MTAPSTDTITVDQFVAAPPSRVWRTLTDPELHARWWAPGDIAAVVGHRFHLEMPVYGSIPCEVVEVIPEEKFVYTFNDSWTLTWRLVPEGRGTRLLLEHSGFDFGRPRDREAFEKMGPGWREIVVPRLAGVAASLED